MNRRRRHHLLHLAAWGLAGFVGFELWSGYLDNPAKSTVLALRPTSSVVRVALQEPKVLDLDKNAGHVSVVSLPLRLKLPPWMKNAVAAPPAHGRPQIAVIMDDAGVNRRNTEKAIALPAPLTISFLPYAPELEPLVKEARAKGHEIMVHLPMEPLGGEENPGPHALMVREDSAQIMRTLDWNLARLDGYVGVNNHMGSRFSADRPAMREVLAELHRRGLLFIDSRTTAHTVGGDVAQQLHMPYAERDVFLDNNEDEAAIRAQLDTLERIAQARGQAVAIGHPYDSTIAVLHDWLASVQSHGFELVPVSRIVELNVREREVASR